MYKNQKVKVTVSSIAEASDRAARQFLITADFFLEAFDKDFDEWVTVTDSTYVLPQKEKLRVSLVDVSDTIIGLVLHMCNTQGKYDQTM